MWLNCHADHALTWLPISSAKPFMSIVKSGVELCYCIIWPHSNKGAITDTREIGSMLETMQPALHSGISNCIYVFKTIFTDEYD